VDKYTWQEVGSSFLPGEIIAAFLWAQLEEAEKITNERLAIWALYHELLHPLEQRGLIRRPIVPADRQHNAHMYYVLLAPDLDRKKVIDKLREKNIFSVFHYVPLHSSPGGKRFGRASGTLEVTDTQSDRLLRLPMWLGLSYDQQSYTIETLSDAIGG
jgi:dTDP-4-amino-4,6-dideoxygalactose transaminase